MINELIINGVIQNIDFQYRRKSDGTIVPVCEMELLESENNLIKITFFYEKAEKLAEIPKGSHVLVKGKLKGTKNGNGKYTLEAWGTGCVVLTEPPENNEKGGEYENNG